MNIKYICPSYKRSKGLKTPYYIKKAKVYVSEDEYNDYIENNEEIKNNIYKMPRDYQGKGKGRCLNWILNEEWNNKTDGIVILDDDIEAIYRWNSLKENQRFDEEDVYEFCEINTLLTKEWGAGMWNINTDKGDNLRHSPFMPFNTRQLGSDAFCCFCQNDGIRYDEKFIVNEGFDLQLQSIKKYHKIIRLNNYYLKVGQWTNDGGYQEIREKSNNLAEESLQLLLNKWGDKIIKVSKKNRDKGAFTINVPFKGV